MNFEKSCSWGSRNFEKVRFQDKWENEKWLINRGHIDIGGPHVKLKERLRTLLILNSRGLLLELRKRR